MSAKLVRWKAAGLLVIGTALASCPPAQAASWQCLAPDGSFAKHDVSVAASDTELSGTMTIRAITGDGRWMPTARVAFTDGARAEADCHCNGIVATRYRDYPDLFLVSLLADGEQIPLGSVPADKPVTFRLLFGQDGALRLEVGTGVATGRTSSPTRNNLHLSCSTAEVDFAVAVTVVAPPPKSPERCPFAAQERWTAVDVDRYCKARR